MSLLPFAPPGAPRRSVRPRHFRITHLVLSIRLEFEARRVAGTVTHTLELLPHGSGQRSVTLDRHGVDVREVSCEGEAVAWSVGPGEVTIELPAQGTGPFHLKIRFRTEQPAKGLYFIDPDEARGRRAMCWTQGAMSDHSWWFPCFDDPNNQATCAWRIEHDARYQAVAGGVCEGREERGATAITTYRQDHPHVLYLLTLAVGDFAVVEDAGGPVPVSHVVPRGREDQAATTFRATRFAITWLSRFLATAFPWPRYGHVAVHDFMWGGMENATLTTITDRVLIDAATAQREGVDADALVIHELVHQWFGDLVTMKGWSDIWLNESFATYLEARCLAAWRDHRDQGRGEDVLAEELRANLEVYLAQERERYSRPLVTERWVDAYELFDRVAYEKGSLVLHHLEAVLGEHGFRAALARYLERHAPGLVETADFRQACAEVSGEPLDWFFAQWLERPGHPRLQVRWRYLVARRQLLVEVEQQQAATDPEASYRLPLELVRRDETGRHRERHVLDASSATWVIACERRPDWVCLDPRGTLPVEWDEQDGVEGHRARLLDAELEAAARARSADALGSLHPQPGSLEALGRVLEDGDAPRLVRDRAARALAALRTPDARERLLGAWSGIDDPRLRRVVAEALGAFRGEAGLAARLVELADAESSQLVAGALLAARGALRVPGAVPLLRARWQRPSWNQRLRIGAIQGLGASGEAAAIDDLLPLLGAEDEHEPVRCAAAAAAAQLGGEHRLAVTRIRLALEQVLPTAGFRLRAALGSALGKLGDPAADPALAAAEARERYGILSRIYREARERLRRAAAREVGDARMRDRVEQLERKLTAAERAIEALTRRLDG